MYNWVMAPQIIPLDVINLTLLSQHMSAQCHTTVIAVKPFKKSPLNLKNKKSLRKNLPI